MINYNISDLFDLVWFAFAGTGLQIQNLRDFCAPKYMVAALDAFLKSQTSEQLSHSRKRNVCISISAENLSKQFLHARHNLWTEAKA